MDIHLINIPVIGGAETIAVKLTKKINHNSKLVTLISSRSSLFERRFNIKLHSILFLIKATFRNKLKRIFSHGIQVHSFINIYSFLMKSIFFKNYKIINVIHFDANYVGKFWLYFYIFTIKLNNPKLIFVSKFSFDRFNQFFDTSKISSKIIYNSIDDKFFRYKKYNNFAANYNFKMPLKVGFIGRVSKIKRISLFLEICISLYLIDKNKYQFMVQSDIKKEILYKRIKSLTNKYSLNIDNTSFSLIPEYEDPIKFYEACDIVISCSSTESFGLTCIESLAMGKRLYTVNSKSLDKLFDIKHINIICEDPHKISKFIDHSILKFYKIPDLSKYKEKYMINEYSKI